MSFTGSGIPNTLMRQTDNAEHVAEINVSTVETALQFAQAEGHVQIYCYRVIVIDMLSS